MKGDWGRAPPGGEEERRHSNKHSRHPGDRASGSPVLPGRPIHRGWQSEHLARAAISLAWPLLYCLLLPGKQTNESEQNKQIAKALFGYGGAGQDLPKLR